MNTARDKGTAFTDDISQNEIINAYKQQLAFVAENNLIEGSQRRLAQFEQQIQTYHQIIEKEKIFST